MTLIIACELQINVNEMHCVDQQVDDVPFRALNPDQVFGRSEDLTKMLVDICPEF